MPTRNTVWKLATSVFVFSLLLSHHVSSVTKTILTNGVPVSIPSLAKKEALYYSFTVPQGMNSLSVKTTGVSGDVDIYLSKGNLRTIKAATWRSIKNASVENITLSRPL